MNKYAFFHNGRTYERITKRQARREYINGRSVVMIACNLRPFTPWNNEMVLNRKDREQFVIDEIGVNNDFTNTVASFEYYNCTNSETGKYTAFYIEK
jgi:hypothetical protein